MEGMDVINTLFRRHNGERNCRAVSGFTDTSLDALTPKINGAEWTVFWKVSTGEYVGCLRTPKRSNVFKWNTVDSQGILGFADHRSNNEEQTRASS